MLGEHHSSRIACLVKAVASLLLYVIKQSDAIWHSVLLPSSWLWLNQVMALAGNYASESEESDNDQAAKDDADKG